MKYVYINQSAAYINRYYKGVTSDVGKRLLAHNAGRVPSTRRWKPWKNVFYAAFTDEKVACAFEKYLKTASGIAFMRKRLLGYDQREKSCEKLGRV
ncbi:MAG: GIY-YIG nuclease family protein [Candidatus Komeilibacteria bacterium]|nr:GIY-YIG nuclease family protein [Candidatus Komeilibacteria bacterium]